MRMLGNSRKGFQKEKWIPNAHTTTAPPKLDPKCTTTTEQFLPSMKWLLKTFIEKGLGISCTRLFIVLSKWFWNSSDKFWRKLAGQNTSFGEELHLLSTQSYSYISFPDSTFIITVGAKGTHLQALWIWISMEAELTAGEVQRHEVHPGLPLRSTLSKGRQCHRWRETDSSPITSAIHSKNFQLN